MTKTSTKQHILETAFNCIANRGYHSVSLRNVAEEAGVALSQLNYYFGNREGLFTAVLEHMRSGYIRDVKSKLPEQGSVAEKLDFLVMYNRDLLETNSRLYSAFLDFFNLAMWSESFNKGMNEFVQDISDRIHENMASNSKIDCCNEEKLTGLINMIMATSFGSAMQYTMNEKSASVLQGFDVLRDMIQAQFSAMQS